MILPSITRRLVALAAAAFWLLGQPFARADEPKRVLILSPFTHDTTPFSSVVSVFRTALAAEFDEPVDFREIPLDMGRQGDGQDEMMADLIVQRLASRPVDLVVPIGGTGARFAAQHHGRLFGDTPVLLAGAEPRMVPEGYVGERVALVSERIDLPGMIEEILRLKPSTKRIAVVFGASDLEKHWVAVCRREFEPFSKRVEFLWLDGLPLDELIARSSKLPPDTFIFHGFFIEDANGVPSLEGESLRRLRDAANAPVFSPFDCDFGIGPVGGQLHQTRKIGREAARVAARILRGESPGVIAPVILDPATAEYDWRELSRWNIPVRNLPAKHIIRFREPGFWERYRWPAIVVISLGVLQAALIVGLLVNRGRLRQAQKAKRQAMEQTMELRDTLSHTGRVSLLGQLASSLAHELSQPLGAILRNAEAAEIMLKHSDPDLDELRAIIDDILRDDHRAGDVIQKLRSLLRKGHLDMQPLDIGAVAHDVIGLLHSDATERHIHLTAEIEPGLPEIPGDRIHLQQVLLNLIVNAMDALDANDKDNRQVRVIARMADTDHIEVKVCDNGPGIPADNLGRLFEPFFTTKAAGMGMGLLVSKTIVEAHKGKLTVENNAEGGACFRFTLHAA